MTKINWQDYLAAEPLVHHGDLCFRGTRIPVSIILGSLADGMTAEEIRAAYPQLEPVQIRAALRTLRNYRSQGLYG